MGKLALAGVESSNLKAVGYCGETHTLAIQFKDDSLYIYPGVPQKTYEELLKAESIGSHFNKIKSSYLYAKVEMLVTPKNVSGQKPVVDSSVA